MTDKPAIGFTCAYTPLPLIDAAGFSPYRILPVGDCPDQAGHLLHDNLCPHIKRILDRAIARDLPDLDGVVFVNSCDAMRRLADAWQHVRKNDRITFIDLPATIGELAEAFIKDELVRMAGVLAEWRGNAIKEADIEKSIETFNRIAARLQELSKRYISGRHAGGYAALQSLYNTAATSAFDATLKQLDNLSAAPDESNPEREGVSIYLFGNVMPEPEAFSLMESCDAVIVDADFCTGSRLFSPIAGHDAGDVFTRLARHIQRKPPCARTFDPLQPGALARDTIDRARAVNARGVIGHVVKFCDPYLERLPGIREYFRDAGMPLLILEGDCTLRSIGQQKTRIEAFIEMLR